MTAKAKDVTSRPSRAGPTVAAGLVRALLDVAVDKGADRDRLLERAAIKPADLEDPDNRVPLESYRALMHAGQALAGDPALALHFGEAVSLPDVSIVGLIAQASETMTDAFLQVNRFASLLIEVDTGGKDRLELAEDGEGSWLVDNRTNPNDFPELTESSFARMVCSARRFSGGQSFVKAVHVTHARPAYSAEYDTILQIPVTFASNKNALLLDASWSPAHMPPRSSRYVFGILSDRAERLLKELEATKTVRALVESTIIPILHKGDPGVDAIAGKMAMSRKTLYRKLKDEGTTYERLLDELRRRMAEHYLSGKKTSVNETAYLVGFSEPAAFSRAFKRWTGKNPRDLRNETR